MFVRDFGARWTWEYFARVGPPSCRLQTLGPTCGPGPKPAQARQFTPPPNSAPGKPRNSNVDTTNDRGITNRGKRWYKGGLHHLLTNEAYTGTAVWGRTSKGEKAQDPVRVERAWPARVGSKFLLSGLLKCGVCGRP